MPNPNGAVAGNDQNTAVAQTPRTRSTFPLHYHFFNTHRFGEYVPHYVDDLTKDDRFPVRSSGSLRSYTLKSPLFQNIKRNKDYFLVPMEAILPLNWEKFFDNPVRGDDVLDDVGPSVEDFWSKVATLYSSLGNSLQGILGDNTTTTPLTIQAIFRYLVIGEYFYSNGNLLSSLGCHGSSYLSVSGLVRNFDGYFDNVISELISFFSTYISAPTGNWFTLNVDGYSYIVNNIGDSGDNNYYYISLRHALQLMRDNPTFTISNVASVIVNNLSTFKSHIEDAMFNDYYLTPISASVPCNLSRLWAYQLCVSHYMSNDHIDFVYSADLFRQLIGSYYRNASTNTIWNTSSIQFSRNGVTYMYDWLSAHVFTNMVTISSQGAVNWLTDTSSSTTNSRLGYLSALFGYRRSLRYLDYFTGSRSQPLAVVNTAQINTNVSVNQNMVSVIDISKSIQAQRFLNSVNRVRHSFEGYLKGIFGGTLPAPDYHNPFYIAHTDDVVFGQETENTGSAQLVPEGSLDKALPIAVTTNLRCNSGNYMFDVAADRPCIIIGITSYDITRVYTKTTERSFLHLNRFDWFNPFMQYIGDQPVYLQELGINPNSNITQLRNFAYQLRHSEFKQKFNQASGAFCNLQTDLNNWIFVAKDARGDQNSINPDWIRSLNCEIDDFYVSLSGWSLGTYFHFIVDDFNSVNASRPMAYSPQILG